MKVKVKRCEIKSGERKDGTSYTGTSAVVIFNDGCTASQIFVGEEVCDPCDIEVNGFYDMYRDEKGYCLVFDKLQAPQPNNK